MFVFLKSLSRAVHEENQNQPSETEADSEGACTSLTVWRKSLVMSCNGFTVIDSNGDLVYRVDNYVGGCSDELTLMDAAGKSLLTLHRHKKLAMVDTWSVYEGDDADDYCGTGKRKKLVKRPIWYVKKSSNRVLQPNSNVLAYVHGGTCDKRRRYVIQGSYSHRSCKVMDVSNRVVAEIKRKEASVGGVSFGMEVFVLVVKSGFDPGFAMALVVLLDQMFT